MGCCRVKVKKMCLQKCQAISRKRRNELCLHLVTRDIGKLPTLLLAAENGERNNKQERNAVSVSAARENKPKLAPHPRADIR